MRFISSIASLALVAGSAAYAQVRSNQGGPQNDRLQVTPAALPAPVSGLGGVRSAAPRPIPINQPPAQPQYRPMPVAPWPGAIINAPTPAPSPAPDSRAPAFDGRGIFINPGSGTVFPTGSSSSFSTGSGLTVNGTYQGDRLRLALHLGSDAFTTHRFRSRGGVPIVHACPTWWNEPYYGYPGYYSAWYGNRYGNIQGFYSPPDPAMTYTPAPPPASESVTPSTNRELGDAYLQAGDPRAAIKAYQAHLKQYPGDEQAMRALGLALIDSGQTVEGVALIAMAYSAEPLLCDYPVASDVFRYGTEGLRRNVSRVSIYANRVNTPSGWLTLAVLMQAQGRADLASTMVERARAAGLETVVADRMNSALR